jgi:hypothetical protein
MRFSLHLATDGATNITEISVTAIYTKWLPDYEVVGHAHAQVGPFDDLAPIIERVLVDAVATCTAQATDVQIDRDCEQLRIV